MHCLKIYSFSDSPEREPFFRRSVSTPGVSISETKPSRIGNYFLSLVVPRWASTIAMFYPIRLLNKLLFPQFGRPTKETLNLPSPSTPLFQGLGVGTIFLYFFSFRTSICSTWSGVWRMSCEFLALFEKKEAPLKGWRAGATKWVNTLLSIKQLC